MRTLTIIGQVPTVAWPAFLKLAQAAHDSAGQQRPLGRMASAALLHLSYGSDPLKNVPPERPDADPLKHDNPEIDELEDNEPIEMPEVEEMEKPQPDIDEIEQGDVEPEINNL